MIRILVLRLLLFVLPFVLYALYMRFVKKRALNDPAVWGLKRLLGLVSVSIIIVTISFFWLALTAETNKDGDYEPARMEDGKLVPGKIDDEQNEDR